MRSCPRCKVRPPMSANNTYCHPCSRMYTFEYRVRHPAAHRNHDAKQREKRKLEQRARTQWAATAPYEEIRAAEEAYRAEGKQPPVWFERGLRRRWRQACSGREHLQQLPKKLARAAERFLDASARGSRPKDYINSRWAVR